MKIYPSIYIALFIGFTIWLVGCSPISFNKTLTTIFDGVPPLESANNLAQFQGDSLAASDSLIYDATTSSYRIIKYDYHEPYQQKKCESCHSPIHMGELVMEEPALCFSCHEDQQDFESTVHGPVSGGFCTSCHRPHLSEENSLLIDGGDNLCFNCHDQTRAEASIIHQRAKRQEQCIDCHNPHSGENRFMLASGKCYSCHEEKLADYSFLHGPVAGNYCSTCHTGHESGKEMLLVDQSPALCLGCHTESTLFLNAEHKTAMSKNCTECHNPHGGENQFLLN